MTTKRKVGLLVVSLLASFSAAALGSLATFANITTWYATLQKPPFNPPNWLFGPVWTILYILIGISLYLILVTPKPKSKKFILILFGAQLALNAAWSLVFFGLHAPLASGGVIIALLCSIVALIYVVWPIKNTAALLLVPYAAWVSFATVLTLSIILLN